MIEFTYQGGPLDGQKVTIPKLRDAVFNGDGYPCAVNRRDKDNKFVSAEGLYRFARAEDGIVTATHVPSPRDKPFPPDAG